VAWLGFESHGLAWPGLWLPGQAGTSLFDMEQAVHSIIVTQLIPLQVGIRIFIHMN
jgi:hypothetical protein